MFSSIWLKYELLLAVCICVKKSIIQKSVVYAINPTTLPSRTRRVSDAQDLEMLYQREEPPKRFPGIIKDIPKTIQTAKPGTLTVYGNATTIWRKTDTKEDCYRECLYEQLIDCNYYFMDMSDNKCILMDQNIANVHIENHGSEISTHNSDNLGNLKQMLEVLQERLNKSLGSVYYGTESQQHGIRNVGNQENSIQKTLQLLSASVTNLKLVNPHIIEKINMMDNRIETIAGEVDNMENYENEMADALTEMEKKITNLNTELTTARLANSKLSRQIKNEVNENPELTRQISALKRHIMELKSRAEVNPTLSKMIKNQKILSESLEGIDHEITMFSKRAARLEETTNDWADRLTAEEEHRKTINEVIKTITKAVKDIRKDVARLKNPLSAENAERTKEMNEIRSDVDVLVKSNAKLEQDVFHIRSDLTRLVKDLVSVQLSNYESKKSIIALVDANKNLKIDFNDERINQNQMITQIQTLSSIYKSVLTSLHNLELKQIQVIQHLRKYENDVRRISSDVLGNQNNLLSVSKLKNQILHMPIISEMKKFQIKLLKAVQQLKEDLFKIKTEIKAKRFLFMQAKANPNVNRRYFLERNRLPGLNFPNVQKKVNKFQSNMMKGMK